MATDYPRYFVYYFTRMHRTLRVTPAMQTGVTDHLWDVDVALKEMDRLRKSK